MPASSNVPCHTPAVDLPKLAAAIARIGDAALALGPTLGTLEINPLVADGERIEALDALVVEYQAAQLGEAR